MARNLGPGGVVGWLAAPDKTHAGAAFGIGPDIAVTGADGDLRSSGLAQVNAVGGSTRSN